MFQGNVFGCAALFIGLVLILIGAYRFGSTGDTVGLWVNVVAGALVATVMIIILRARARAAADRLKQ